MPSLVNGGREVTVGFPLRINNPVVVRNGKLLFAVVYSLPRCCSQRETRVPGCERFPSFSYAFEHLVSLSDTRPERQKNVHPAERPRRRRSIAAQWANLRLQCAQTRFEQAALEHPEARNTRLFVQALLPSHPIGRYPLRLSKECVAEVLFLVQAALVQRTSCGPRAMALAQRTSCSGSCAFKGDRHGYTTKRG